MDQILQREGRRPQPGGAVGAGERGTLQRGQFTFYASFFQAVDSLPQSRQLEVYRAIMEYALYGVEPSLTGSSASVFSVVRAVLESGRSKANARLKQGTSDK